MEFPRALGPYTLLCQLGEGGMGRVFLAVSGAVGLETLCVIKTMLPELKADAGAVARFRHEADVVRRLVHGNLISTHAVGEAAGEVFLVQDFVEGKDLGTFLDKVVLEADKPSRELSCYIIREVARALAFAHSFEGLGLVHCDLSPSNIRLTYAGEVKLMDFGVAASRLLSANGPDAQMRFGKLAYMAPEQIEGGLLTPAVDVYAMGVLLWEMLTGEPLGTELKTRGIVRPGESSTDELKARLASQFERPSCFDRNIPHDLDDLVISMLNRSPADRPSAEWVRVSLTAFIPPKFNPEGVVAAAMERYFRRAFEREARESLVANSRSKADHSPPIQQIATNDSPAASKTLPIQRAETKKSRPWLIPAVAGSAVVLALVWASQRTQSNDAPPPLAPRPPTVAIVPTPPPVPEVKPEPPPSVPEPQAIKLAKPAAHPRPSTLPEKPTPAPSQPAAPHASPAVELAFAKEAFARRDLETARKSAIKAIESGGGAEAYSVLGNVHFKTEHWADAVAAYEKAAALAPNDELVSQRLRLAKAKQAAQAP
jgi:serine/threonine protein kinase